jgi:hypothetical protein
VKTLVAPILDQLGLSKGTNFEQGENGPTLRTRTHATPAGEVRRRQPERIPVDVGHDENPVGEVIYLERVANGALWCVAHAAVDPAPWLHPLFWSAVSESDAATGGDVLIRGASITTSPRQLGLSPLVFLPGRLDHRRAPDRWSGLDTFRRGLLERAAAYHLGRERGEPLIVVDPSTETTTRGLHPTERFQLLEDEAERVADWYAVGGPPGKLRYRPSRILSIR